MFAKNRSYENEYFLAPNSYSQPLLAFIAFGSYFVKIMKIFLRNITLLGITNN